MKILYVATVSNTINAFLIPHIKMLINLGHRVDIAVNIDQLIHPTIQEMGCRVFTVPFQRKPLHYNNFQAYWKLKDIITNEKYNIVHTHTPVASAIARLVCRNFGNVKVIYTSHGFHFYQGAPIANWLIHYPVEKWLANFTDVLITLNKEDFLLAQNKLKARRVEYVPGVGLDLGKFSHIDNEKSIKLKELCLPSDSFVILSVGELNKNKNHKTVIKALSKLTNLNIYYLICGQGPLEGFLKIYIKKHKLEKKVFLLGFRKDIGKILHDADLFVFPSIREGLPVALMEAMLLGLPVLCSDIRGNRDLVYGLRHGRLVKHSDFNAYAQYIYEIYHNPRILIDGACYGKNRMYQYSVSSVTDRIKSIFLSLGTIGFS